jgi:hypothetical protein
MTTLMATMTATASSRSALSRLGKALIAGCALGAAYFASPPASAMQNEPSGFMGIDWGAPIDHYKRDLTTLNEDETGGNYRRASDRMVFAGVDARRISYRFYKSKFSSGMVLTVGTSDFRTMLAHLVERYGEPNESNPRHRVYTWSGERAGITISCDISYGCYTEFYDRALRDEELAQGGASLPRKDDN